MALTPSLILENAALRTKVEELTEQMKAARAEVDLVTEERDMALLRVEEAERINARLAHRLDIAHGEGGK